MKETAKDLDELQSLINNSIEKAGPFLREAFQMPQKSLSAASLAAHLQGLRTVALATVTASTAPRVAPVGALFYRGHYCVPTQGKAARVRHIQANPLISLTDFDGMDFAVIVHGRASLITPNHADFEALDELLARYSSSKQGVLSWGEDGLYIRIEAQTLVTFARYPERFADV